MSDPVYYIKLVNKHRGPNMVVNIDNATPEVAFYLSFALFNAGKYKQIVYNGRQYENIYEFTSAEAGEVLDTMIEKKSLHITQQVIVMQYLVSMMLYGGEVSPRARQIAREIEEKPSSQREIIVHELDNIAALSLSYYDTLFVISRTIDHLKGDISSEVAEKIGEIARMAKLRDKMVVDPLFVDILPLENI